MNKNSYIALLTSLLIGCGGVNTKTASKPAPPIKATPSTSTSQQTATPPKQTSAGGYYLDDGPEANPPTNIANIPNAAPRIEPINRATSRPYKALGKRYVPMKSRKPLKETGIASWYGKRFHGRKTANGETYDMYGMTAAHKTLPLPSYIRVTNPKNQRSVVVRVNDRGPFIQGRIVDLSYAAASKLGYIKQGSTKVILETIDPQSYQASHQAVTRAPYSTQLPTTTHTTTHIPAYYVQVGAFRELGNVHQLKQKIVNARITKIENMHHVYNGDMYKVRLGPYARKHQADQIASSIRQKLNITGIINKQ